MPYKPRYNRFYKRKNITRRKYYKRKTYKRYQKSKMQIFRPQRGLRPAIHPFKRQLPHQVVTLNAVVPATGWDTTHQHLGFISKLWIFKLSEFNNNNDFTDLFRYYKLNAVNLKIYPCCSLEVAARNNSQVIVTTLSGRDGDPANSRTPTGLETVQARKDRLLLNNNGTPFSIFMKLNQLTMVYASAHGVPPSQTNYTLTKPKYVSTAEPDCEHYGLWIYLRTCNGTAFDNIQVRIEPTVYLSCKTVE